MWSIKCQKTVKNGHCNFTEPTMKFLFKSNIYEPVPHGRGCLPAPSCGACARPSEELRPLLRWSDSQTSKTWGTSDSLWREGERESQMKSIQQGNHVSTVILAESTWCGELRSVSKATILLLIGMRQLLEAAISNIWGEWRTLSWVCSDGRAFL